VSAVQIPCGSWRGILREADVRRHAFLACCIIAVEACEAVGTVVVVVTAVCAGGFVSIAKCDCLRRGAASAAHAAFATGTARAA